MPHIAGHPRLIILANALKSVVNSALEELRPWLSQRAAIVAEPDIRKLTRDSARELPAADLVIVLGGDGTMLAQARHILDLHIPMLGINFGKLGFIAEFSLDDFRRHWHSIAAGTFRTVRRLMIDVLVFDAEAADCAVDQLDMDHCKFRSPALNDAVITAGEPFRMVEMELVIEPGPHTSATRVVGDGVIVSTPAGSTAYNVGAGGPIVGPGVDALCITPICVHSLAFRSLVVRADSGICVRLNSANHGTTLVIDGQETVPMAKHEQLYVHKQTHPLLLVSNPEVTYWKMLAQKMHWAASPQGV